MPQKKSCSTLPHIQFYISHFNALGTLVSLLFLLIRIHIYIYLTICNSLYQIYTEMKVKSLLYIIKIYTQIFLSVV